MEETLTRAGRSTRTSCGAGKEVLVGADAGPDAGPDEARSAVSLLGDRRPARGAIGARCVSFVC